MYNWRCNDGITRKLDDNCVCPYCHTGVNNEIHSATFNGKTNDVFLLAECPLCHNMFFIENYLSNSREKIWSYRRTFPSNATLGLPKQIIKSYPEFAHIYAQSLIAHESKLDKIAGMGLRKALEYLVKPYVKAFSPESSESIDKESLSATIKRIPYPLITKLATAAVWLANDQVHVQQWHTDYDFEDINKFIKALCHLIEAEQIASDDTPGILNNPRK